MRALPLAAAISCALYALIFWVLTLAPGSAGASWSPPPLAREHFRELVRESRLQWGLGAPVARLAAQIQQESGWRANVSSKYADGLSQFTPPTARWITDLYPEQLGTDPAPFSPTWAIRALVIYDHHLYQRIQHTELDRARWAMTLSAYNGGAGFVARDRALCAADAGCDPGLWWGNVELHTSRAAWARKENRDYVVRILCRWEPLYVAAGWPGEAFGCDPG